MSWWAPEDSRHMESTSTPGWMLKAPPALLRVVAQQRVTLTKDWGDSTGAAWAHTQPALPGPAAWAEPPGRGQLLINDSPAWVTGENDWSTAAWSRLIISPPQPLANECRKAAITTNWILRKNEFNWREQDGFQRYLIFRCAMLQWLAWKKKIQRWMRCDTLSLG